MRLLMVFFEETNPTGSKKVRRKSLRIKCGSVLYLYARLERKTPSLFFVSPEEGGDETERETFNEGGAL